MVADGARDRLRKSAELDVKVPEPEAPVITKPFGAEIGTEPSCWVGASLVMANAKAALEPAAGFAGETVTAKHLPDGRQAPADVAPAAGVASIAATSVLAASTPRETHASVNPGFRTAAPFICRNRGA